jgi:hypothetical protein
MTEPVLITQPAGNNSRVKKIGVVGLIVLLLVFVGPKLLGGGGGAPSEDDSFTPPSSVPTTAAPHGDDVETLGSYGTKNPFTPLMDLTSSESEQAPAASAPVGPGPDPGLVALPGGDASFLDPGGEAATPTTPTTLPPRPTHRLSLLEVYRTQSGITAARVRVDDDVMETAVGQDFGGNYRTISLDRDSGCGVFLFGDERLTLCEGHEAIT